MEREINKKLQNMKKSQLEKVCGKMRCPKGTKKEMIIRLLRPLRKYKMDKILIVCTSKYYNCNNHICDKKFNIDKSL